jgi:transposase
LKTMSSVRYSEEIKRDILERVLGPKKESVLKVAKERKINKATIYKWVKEAEGIEEVETKGTRRNWTSNEKFHMVLEAASLTEQELGEYCRRKGIFTEDIKTWTVQCMNANSDSKEDPSKLKEELKEEKERNKKIEKELRVKEKALAEAAALLVLRKNVQAIWGDKEEE